MTALYTRLTVVSITRTVIFASWPISHNRQRQPDGLVYPVSLIDPRNGVLSMANCKPFQDIETGNN